MIEIEKSNFIAPFDLSKIIKDLNLSLDSQYLLKQFMSHLNKTLGIENYVIRPAIKHFDIIPVSQLKFKRNKKIITLYFLENWIRIRIHGTSYRLMLKNKKFKILQIRRNNILGEILLNELIQQIKYLYDIY